MCEFNIFFQKTEEEVQTKSVREKITQRCQVRSFLHYLFTLLSVYLENMYDQFIH